MDFIYAAPLNAVAIVAAVYAIANWRSRRKMWISGTIAGAVAMAVSESVTGSAGGAAVIGISAMVGMWTVDLTRRPAPRLR